MYYYTYFDCLRHILILLLLFYPPPFFLLSFVQSHICSFSLSIQRTSYYYVIVFLRHFYHFYQAAVAIKISHLLICFCSFDLSCPKFEKKNIFIENLYIVLSCLIKIALVFSSIIRPVREHEYIDDHSKLHPLKRSGFFSTEGFGELILHTYQDLMFHNMKYMEDSKFIWKS